MFFFFSYSVDSVLFYTFACDILPHFGGGNEFGELRRENSSFVCFSFLTILFMLCVDFILFLCFSIWLVVVVTHFSG